MTDTKTHINPKTAKGGYLTARPITSQFASVTAHNKFGIPRSSLIYMMQNQFYYDKKYSDCLSSYHILQWECKYLLSEVREGMLYKEGIAYQVIYHKTDPTRIKRAGNKHATSYVRISFRVAALEFDVPPVALVKLYANPEGEAENE